MGILCIVVCGYNCTIVAVRALWGFGIFVHSGLWLGVEAFCVQYLVAIAVVRVVVLVVCGAV